MTIETFNEQELAMLLKQVTGIDYERCNQAPDDALFALKGVRLNHFEEPCIEWIVKNPKSLFIATEPLLKLDTWEVPEFNDMGDFSPNAITQQMNEEAQYFHESICQVTYLINKQFGTTILVENSPTPCLYAHLGNHLPKEVFVMTVKALQCLLPELLNI